MQSTGRSRTRDCARFITISLLREEQMENKTAVKNAAERDWARRAKKLLKESDGTVSMPTYSHHDVFGVFDLDHATTLYARCPFCHELNRDDHIRVHQDYSKKQLPKGACEHFVKMIGGCGAYDFVFREDK